MALLGGLLLLNYPDRIIKPRIDNVFKVKSACESVTQDIFTPLWMAF